jgi:zinc transport system ATP-binding protein
MSLVSDSKAKLGYNNIPVVDGVSFNIDEKDFICIVGPNGAGKTTLVRGILGLIPLMSGKIKFGLNENQIGYMPQETTVDANFPASVFEIVLSGSLNKRGIFYSVETKKRASETLQLLGISKLEKQSFSELSGGQRQKVLLARALMATDKLLILDEPSNNLDQKSKESLYELVQKLNSEQDIAIVMVTHDLDHGNLIGNKILSLAPKDYFFGSTEEYVRKVHHE